ncbi:PREDICTED: uncharacterized protein LOC102027537 [Chinchilla lanigera]|uniref:uncharacterized protein LOC102027537 n=1 Tax=Chinchilla lanigera TaxID=34839 RepID=UPI000698CA41|nr:PREDICTED: uncharacterized protein LOC102027537 [Chinchilla lanigera]
MSLARAFWGQGREISPHPGHQEHLHGKGRDSCTNYPLPGWDKAELHSLQRRGRWTPFAHRIKLGAGVVSLRVPASSLHFHLIFRSFTFPSLGEPKSQRLHHSQVGCVASACAATHPRDSHSSPSQRVLWAGAAAVALAAASRHTPPLVGAVLGLPVAQPGVEVPGRCTASRGVVTALPASVRGPREDVGPAALSPVAAGADPEAGARQCDAGVRLELRARREKRGPGVRAVLEVNRGADRLGVVQGLGLWPLASGGSSAAGVAVGLLQPEPLSSSLREALRKDAQVILTHNQAAPLPAMNSKSMFLARLNSSDEKQDLQREMPKNSQDKRERMPFK